MKIHSVGLKDLDEGEIKTLVGERNLVWLAYDYDLDYYEGDGKALAMDVNGKFYTADLSHCSCYGPTNDGFVDESLENILKVHAAHWEIIYSDKLVDKVKELLGCEVLPTLDYKI